MPIYLRPVTLPERCYLREVLLWLAFQRLPTAVLTLDGKEIRDTDEVGIDASGVVEGYIFEDETERAGIPPDPNWKAVFDDQEIVSVHLFDRRLQQEGLASEEREELEARRRAAAELERKNESWFLEYERAIEYPASRIFVNLKNGTLQAKGRPLPVAKLDDAVVALESDDRNFFDIDLADIPPSFWTLQGMDFHDSTATDGKTHYGHISFSTQEVLSVFPGDAVAVDGVERVGDVFLLSEKAHRVRPASRRGRPPFPWDQFHLEVAALLLANELPEKKEAAIEHFRSWFASELGLKASRSAVGEKLKPYYDRFFKDRRQKS
jgi:hypothetical protein